MKEEIYIKVIEIYKKSFNKELGFIKFIKTIFNNILKRLNINYIINYIKSLGPKGFINNNILYFN